MSLHHTESLEKLKRQRRRIRRARLIWLGASLFILWFLLVTTLIFTVGYWAPPALSRLTPRFGGAQIKIGSLDCFPLGQLAAQNMVCRNNNAKEDALAVDRIRITYSGLWNLLRGQAQILEMSALRINNVEAVRLVDDLRSRWTKPGKPQPLQATIARWMPERVKLSDLNFITSANKEYHLKTLQTSRTLTARNDVLLGVSLETGPLRDILPLQVAQPLQLSAVSIFTPDSFRLLSITSNLGSLLQAEANEPKQLKEGEAIALQMKDVRFDLNQWVEILDLPVAGTLEFDLHVPQWRFGRANEPQPWTGGLGPNALFSQMNLDLQPFKWLEFHPGWSIAEGHPLLNLSLAATPNFRQAWLHADTSFQAKQILTPNGSVDDLRISLRGDGSLEKGKIVWSNSMEAVFPEASSRQPQNLRLRLSGQTSGTLMLESSLVKSRFAFTPSFERKDLDPFVIPMEGSVQYQKSTGALPGYFGLSSDGRMAGGQFALAHSGSTARSSTTLSLRDIALPEFEKGARVINRQIPVHLTGKLSSALDLEQETSKPLRMAGDLTFRRLQPFGLDNRPMLKYPIDLQAKYALSRNTKSGNEWAIPRLSLEANRYFRLLTTGKVQKTENLLSVQLSPSLEIGSLARFMDLTSQTLGAASADGRVGVQGAVDWRQNQKIARIQFHGNASLSSASVVNSTSKWGFSGLSGKMPLTAIWYQDMIRGGKERPMGALEVALAPTALNINRAEISGKQYRWLELMMGLHGRLFLNPETPGRRRPKQLLVLECDEVAAEIPDMIKMQGDVECEWRQHRVNGPFHKSGEINFSAQVSDTEGLAQLLQIPLSNTDIKGQLSVENGRAAFSDATTTCSGQLALQSKSGETRQVVAWKDLGAKMDFALQRENRASTMTLQATGEAKAGQLTVGGIHIYDAAAIAEFQEKLGQLDILHCRLLDGVGEMASTIDFNKLPTAIEASAKGYELDLATFTREFHPGHVLMDGKVDVKASLGHTETGEITFEAQVSQASSEIRIDKNTVRQLVVEWAQRTGMGFSMGAEEITLRRDYKNIEMIPFDEFEITSRYEDGRFINRIVMRNKHFNIVIDNPIDLKVVREFLRIKQQETRGTSTF